MAYTRRAPYLRARASITSTRIGEGSGSNQGAPRSGALSLTCAMRGQGGVSAIAANVSVIHAGVASILGGSALASGTATLVPGVPVGVIRAAAANMNGTSAAGMNATLVSSGETPTSINDNIPSTRSPNIAWPIVGLRADGFDADVGSGRNGWSAPVAATSGNGITFTTIGGVPVADVATGLTITGLHFTSGDALRRIRLMRSVNGSRTIFRNCTFWAGAWQGTPTVVNEDYSSGGSGTNGLRCDAIFEDCTFAGPGDSTSGTGMEVSLINSIVHFYRVLFKGVLSDCIKVGGGSIHECAAYSNGWSPAAHIDFIENPHMVGNLEVYRCYAKIYTEIGVPNPGDGPHAFCKDRLDGYAGSSVNFDRIFEECVVESINNAQGSYFLIRATGGTGATSSGKSRWLNMRGAGYRADLAFYAEIGANATIQGLRDHSNNAAKNGLNEVTAPGVPTGISLASSSAGSFTVSFTAPSNATYVELRLREKGQSRWGLLQRVTSGQSINSTGIYDLDPGTLYEVKLRAVNASAGAGTTGAWSSLIDIRPNGGSSGGGSGTAPDAVSGLSVASYTSTSITLAFTNASGATSHEYRTSTDSGASWSSWATLATNKTVTGLSNVGTAAPYEIQVRGVNSNGAGTASQVRGPGAFGVAGTLTGAGALTAAYQGSVGAVTFSTSDKSSGITLSNGNLTATHTGTDSTNQFVRGNVAVSSGKKYFEYTCNVITQGDDPGIGLANASYSTANWLGETYDGVAYLPDGGLWYGLTQPIGSLAPYTTSDRVRVAFDANARRVWFANGTGSWNNSATADPATGVGGLDISLLTGAIYPIFQSYRNTARGTIVLSGFLYTPPSGFSAI